MSMPMIEQEKRLSNIVDHVIQSVDSKVSPVDHVTQPKEVKVHTSNDDDDDDDDLIPLVNNTVPQHLPNSPHYLRDAMSGTVYCVDDDMVMFV